MLKTDLERCRISTDGITSHPSLHLSDEQTVASGKDLLCRIWFFGRCMTLGCAALQQLSPRHPALGLLRLLGLLHLLQKFPSPLVGGQLRRAKGPAIPILYVGPLCDR